MSRHICFHGHFYQPPRENPWLEMVETQPSAAPYHDWNARVCAEAYRPNTAARILDDRGAIVDIISTYARMSFNFGPTLLSWLETEARDVYQAVLDADRESRTRFSGHGAALAQAYNHVILPLASDRDKKTQVIWGIRDFAHRFHRPPEGLWLPETAVDTATLEVLAEHDLRFAILAPHQAKAVRPIGQSDWMEVERGEIDPRKAYRCPLPSGRSIALFFYDGPLSHDIAFGGVLRNGAGLTRRLKAGFLSEQEGAQLVHAATDGETYGHHHRFGEMALAFCLKDIEASRDLSLTLYGEFLEKYPPANEVAIRENTSWSCVHGVERWRADCGCAAGRLPGVRQDWRSGLRSALDRLRISLDELYEERMKVFTEDPWGIRDEYISLLLDGSPDNREKFFGGGWRGGRLKAGDRTTVLKLLEVQRNGMLMYTSCGWFFDDIAGIESVQVMSYAGRAMHLARELDGRDREPDLLDILEKTPSHTPGFVNGAQVYTDRVKPTEFGVHRAGAHWAMSALLGGRLETRDLGAYRLEGIGSASKEAEKNPRVAGRVRVESRRLEEQRILRFYGVLTGGVHPLIGLARVSEEESESGPMGDFDPSQDAEDRPGILDRLRAEFSPHVYGMTDILDKERALLWNELVDPWLNTLESPLGRMLEGLRRGIRPLIGSAAADPAFIRSGIDLLLNRRLQRLFTEPEVAGDELRKICEEFLAWSISPETQIFSTGLSRWIRPLMSRLQRESENPSHWEEFEATLTPLTSLLGTEGLWPVQNDFYEFCRTLRNRPSGGRKAPHTWGPVSGNAVRRIQKLLGMTCV